MKHEHFIIPSGSSLWWAGLIGFILFATIAITLGIYFKKRDREPQFRRVLFWLFLIREVIFYSHIIYTGKFTFEDSLPLHLCTLSYIGLIFFFYNPKAFLFEFLLLLSFGAAIQSIYTPELTHGYSSYFVFDYYISHGAILFTPLYAYFVLGMRPRNWSWVRIWIAGHLVLATVGCINWMINSNYIYICTPPKVDNPLVKGEFPFHLIGFEIFGTLHIIFLYILFKYVFSGEWKNLIKPNF
jgi:hypothetical integral membrane protein (TIGR02206 family)